MIEDDNFYGAVESHFIKRRGSPLFITPIEWCLIQQWEMECIPLKVVQEGIDRVFERPTRRPGVLRLSYCRQSVKAAFRRFLEVSAGKPGTETSENREAGCLVIAEHLAELQISLEVVRRSWSKRSEEFDRQIRGVVDEVEKLRKNESMEVAGLEIKLTCLEERLLASAASVLFEDERENLRCRAEKSLSSYRARMPEDVYKRALSSAYRKRVRAIFGLRPMSIYSR